MTVPTVTIRNLPAEVHRALRLRAAGHGRSTEAEIRAILGESVKREGRLLVGTALRRFGEELGGIDLDLRRNPAGIEPAAFD